MESNYEIIGNQIRFYFKGDTSHMWNRIESPQYRHAKEIDMWCEQTESFLSHTNCTIDGINQNFMSQTEVTDFLYRWITAYIKTPADTTRAEFRRIIHEDVLWSMTKEVSADLFWQAVKTAKFVMECILYLGEWVC